MAMKLYEVVANVLKVDAATLSEDSNAHNTKNWDSLRHIELMMSVESAFAVRFSLAEIAGMRNLGDMRRLMMEKGVDFDATEEARKTA